MSSVSDDRVADELAIRSLVAKYAEAVSAHDEALWIGTWASDGQWSVMGRTPSGHKELVEVWQELMGGLEFVVQQATSGYVSFDGDSATGRWQVLEFGKMKGGGSLLNIGVYRDECRFDAGEWRFTKRSFSPLYVGPIDLSGPNLPFPTD